MKNTIAGLSAKIQAHKKLAMGILLAVILVLPILMNTNYFRSILIRVLLYALLASSLNIINGYTGQFNIGHAGLYAIGCYTAGILSTRFGWSFWVLLPVSGIVTAFFGYLISIPTRKLSGIYLGLVTLGFSEIIRLVCLNWTALTGGAMGIKNIPRPMLFGLKIKSTLQFYYIILILLIISVLVMRRVINSRVGRAWIAIREDNTAARFLAVNTGRYKSVNFAFGAFFAGIAGCFSAYYYQYIASDMFSVDQGFDILAMVIIGGQGTLIGPMLGAVIVTIITEAFRFAAEYRLVVYAILIITMMWIRPQGIAGDPDSIFAIKGRKKKRRRIRLERK